MIETCRQKTKATNILAPSNRGAGNHPDQTLITPTITLPGRIRIIILPGRGGVRVITRRKEPGDPVMAGHLHLRPPGRAAIRPMRITSIRRKKSTRITRRREGSPAIEVIHPSQASREPIRRKGRDPAVIRLRERVELTRRKEPGEFIHRATTRILWMSRL